MQNDPVPAITEAAATGATALIFADLRATLGVNVVNLIWRHLATFPGALPWAWETLKPIYVSGKVDGEAGRLKAALQVPAREPWPRSLLRSAGVDAAGEASIRTILASYHRSNALNLVALSALMRRLDAAPVAHDADAGDARDVPEAALQGKLPRLLGLDELSPDCADLVLRLNLVGDRNDGRILASLYRHLAYWPGFLALAYAHLKALADDGRLQPLIVQTLGLAHSAGARLQAGTATLPLPAAAREIRGATESFIEHAIGKMVPMVALLMAIMPANPPPENNP